MKTSSENRLKRIEKLRKHVTMLHGEMLDLCSKKTAEEKERENYLKQFQNSEIISPYSAYILNIKKNKRNERKEQSIGSIMLKNVIDKETEQRNNYNKLWKDRINNNNNDIKNTDFTDKWTTSDMLFFSNKLKELI